jgi:hypothetical protein
MIIRTWMVYIVTPVKVQREPRNWCNSSTVVRLLYLIRYRQPNSNKVRDVGEGVNYGLERVNWRVLRWFKGTQAK